jgi:RNA polymerase sigma-70 factor (ECF subfamily)
MEQTDQELVAASLANPHAFSAIVSRYEAPLRRYIRRISGSDTWDSDDILQDVFIKIFTNLNEYDAGLKFSSWIYRIAHNETISFFRKKQVRPRVLALSAEDANLFFEQLSDDTDHAQQAAARYDAGIVQRALFDLEQKYQEVLTLRFLEDKSYTEISDILKIPEGTVATLINRGKKAFKGILEAKGMHTYE